MGTILSDTEKVNGGQGHKLELYDFDQAVRIEKRKAPRVNTIPPGVEHVKWQELYNTKRNERY